MIRLLVIATVLTATGCVGGLFGNDPRCNVENCTAIANCHGAGPLYGAGDISYCVDIAWDAGADYWDAGIAACIQACQAQNLGGVVSCFQQNFGPGVCETILRDGGDPEVLANQLCEPNAGAGPCGPNCMVCGQTCGQAMASCELACSEAADAGACFSCDYDCGQAFVQCHNACPNN